LTDLNRKHSNTTEGPISIGERLQLVAAVSVRQNALRYCLVLTSPLLVTVLLAKALMLLDVIFPLGLATIDIYFSVLMSLSFANVIMITIAIVGILAAWKVSMQRLPNPQVLVGVFGLLILLVFVVALVGNSAANGMPLLSWSAKHLVVLFDAFRWDLLFVLSFMLCCTGLLSHWPDGKPAMRVKWLIVGAQLPLILLSSLEYAHYLKTGVTGSSQLFLYAVTHGSDILPIIASEMDLMLVAAIVVPLLAVLLLSAIVRPRGHSQTVDGTPHVSLQIGWLVWPLIMLLAFTPKLNANAHFFQFEQNIHFAIANGVVTLPFSGSDTATAASNHRRQVKLFDTSRLELAATEQSAKSNVILIILESAGANSTSVSDAGPDNTPFLKSFAEKSTVVEQMYVVVPRTLAAWISVLQGVYPAASNVTMRWGDKLEREDAAIASLPNLLRPFGYQSAFFTPTHLDFENERQLISNIGFDKVVSKSDYQGDEFEIVNYFGYEDRVMQQPILDWIDKNAAAESPLFLTIMTNVGHHNYKPPQSWPVRSFDSPLGEPHNDYLNSLAYIDSFLEDLFKSLADRGVLEDSLVVIIGDHGESFGEHGKNHHMAVMYEESLHVPAIIYSSAATARVKSIPGIWQLPDIFPTIIDMLGYEMRNGSVAGRSLFESAPANRRVYFAGALDNSYLGLREGNLKYIYYFGRRPTEVFNIDIDREERNDLCGDIDVAVIRAIEQDLLAWYQSTKYSLLGGLQ